MITLLFDYLHDKIIVIIRGTEVKFGSTAFGAVMADISGMKLDYKGTCREFPDLELREDWKAEAIKRFKEKISKMKEEEIVEYIIKELKPHGYKLLSIQKQGFRIGKLDG